MDRNTRPKFEKHYGKLEVAEILREPYSGRVFPGYENIDLTFSELETLVLRGRPDWKQALELAKGIYLITDTKTEKRYIGSAYGNVGIWSRWSNYVVTGHGGNVELRALVPAATNNALTVLQGRSRGGVDFMSEEAVNRRPILTPDRRPKLTPVRCV